MNISCDLKYSEVKAGAILGYATIAVNNVVGLLYTPFMLRMLGQTEFGLYSLVASVVGYLTILDLGFGNAIIRYCAKFRAENKLEEQYELFGMFFKLYCLIGLVAFVGGIALYLNVDALFDKSMTDTELSQVKIMMGLMVVNVVFTFPMSIWGGIITAYERFVFHKMVNIIRICLNAVVMIVLLKMDFKAITMVVVLTIFNMLTLSAYAWYCLVKLKVRLYFRKIRFDFLKEILSYSLWIFLAGIVDRIYWSTGQFVIGIYRGAVEIAVFGVAVQLQAFYSSFSFALSGVFLPRLVKMDSEHQSNEAFTSLLIKVGRLQFYVMSLILTGYILFGEVFVNLWAGEGYQESYMISLVFFCGILLSSVMTLTNNILQAKNKLKFRTLSLVITALSVFVICFPAAKYWGGLGCAICISLGIVIGHVLIMSVYLEKSIGLDMKLFWSSIIKIAYIPLICCICTYMILRYCEPMGLITYLAEICIYAIVLTGLLYKFCFNSSERYLFNELVNRLNIFSK